MTITTLTNLADLASLLHRYHGFLDTPINSHDPDRLIRAAREMIQRMGSILQPRSPHDVS